MHEPNATSLDLPGARDKSPSLSSRRRLARRLFGISPGETSFLRRGFRWDSEGVRERLEGVAARFVAGYHCALEEVRLEGLAARLETIPAEVRGFAYEGAGMALALLDTLTPWRPGRLEEFLRGSGKAHCYIAHIGAGWILARLPVSPERLRARLDPVLGWLVLDGYGFHEGFFHWPRSIEKQEVPSKVRGYARKAFDQGLGRSLWFVEGAGPQRIHGRISAFAPDRKGDLWSGAGLACAYAGGVEPALVEDMLRRSGENAPSLVQGAAFAAVSRERAGNPAAQTELACQIFWGCGAAEAAAMVVEDGEGLPPDGEEPAFEIWRRRIQGRFRARGLTS
ncbi:MAG TPA: DUF1702 family protein [Thermoanaerobaculia bacterium]|nr:DUF1702 family protein [Thermoanaerobaculia bacterium]